MHDLDRFLEAQEGTFDAARAEIAAGSKRSHWMWFIFPQLRGLGSSPMAQRYGISDADEAARFLTHPVLGPRLCEMFALMMTHSDRSAEAILGPVDAMKFRSCATLFAAIPDAPEIFGRAREAFFDAPCARTLERISP